MTIYYEGDQARVTHEVFEGEGRFLIAELDRVCVTRPSSARGPVGLIGLATVAGLGGAAAVGAPRLALAVLVGCVVGLVAVLLSQLGGGRTAELRGQYRGKAVCLFRTDDLRLFGQVSRALSRSLERERLARSL